MMRRGTRLLYKHIPHATLVRDSLSNMFFLLINRDLAELKCCGYWKRMMKRLLIWIKPLSWQEGKVKLLRMHSCNGRHYIALCVMMMRRERISKRYICKKIASFNFSLHIVWYVNVLLYRPVTKCVYIFLNLVNCFLLFYITLGGGNGQHYGQEWISGT